MLLHFLTKSLRNSKNDPSQISGLMTKLKIKSLVLSSNHFYKSQLKKNLVKTNKSTLHCACTGSQSTNLLAFSVVMLTSLTTD